MPQTINDAAQYLIISVLHVPTLIPQHTFIQECIGHSV